MDGFMLYTAQYPALQALTQTQKGDLLDALYAYAIDGTEPDGTDPMVRMAFVFMRDAMDRNKVKYEAKCERNRQIALRREQARREAHQTQDTDVHERAPQSTTEHERTPQSTNVHERAPIKTKQNITKTEHNKTKTELNKLPIKGREEKEKEKLPPQASGNFQAPPPSPSSSAEASPGKRGEGESSREESQEDSVSRACRSLKDYWNSRVAATGSMMRRVTLMTEARRALVRARLSEADDDVSVLRLAIDKLIDSSFANGSNERGWTATFDWLMTQQNFVKVLEGNYDNDRPSARPSAARAASGADPALAAAIEESMAKPEKTKDEQLKERLEGIVRLVNRNPMSAARRQLEAYERDGTLARLGVTWEPLLHQKPAAER